MIRTALVRLACLAVPALSAVVHLTCAGLTWLQGDALPLSAAGAFAQDPAQRGLLLLAVAWRIGAAGVALVVAAGATVDGRWARGLAAAWVGVAMGLSLGRQASALVGHVVPAVALAITGPVVLDDVVVWIPLELGGAVLLAVTLHLEHAAEALRPTAPAPTVHMPRVGAPPAVLRVPTTESAFASPFDEAPTVVIGWPGAPHLR